MVLDNGQMNEMSEAALGVVSAGGIPEAHWYVAVVKRNTEKACREKLRQMGIECFVASQEEMRQWSSGKRKLVERVIISAVIFVRATEKERLFTLKLPFIYRYMTNKAQTANDLGRHPVAVIPDHQIQRLRFMLFNADTPVSFTDQCLSAGDRVKVLRGSLRGLEGTIVRSGSDHYVVVDIDLLGCAMVRISPQDVEKTN